MPATADALIVRSDIVDEALFAAAPNLKIVVRAGAGYDNIDLKAATAAGHDVAFSVQCRNGFCHAYTGVSHNLCRAIWVDSFHFHAESMGYGGYMAANLAESLQAESLAAYFKSCGAIVRNRARRSTSRASRHQILRRCQAQKRRRLSGTIR